MVDRAHVLEAAQIGIEATPGTSVSGQIALRSMTVDIDIGGASEIYRPDGHKFAALAIPNAEWTTWAMNGRPTYTEICYLLESIFGTAVATTTVGSTGKKRDYLMLDTAADTAKTLTIEKGSAARAHKLTYGLLHDWALSFSRNKGITMTGNGIGQLLTDGITMTPTPTLLPLVPIVGKQLDLYIDSTWATLGTTKMLRAFDSAPSVTGKYGPIWPINSASTSFAGHVELAPTTGHLITLEADAAGMAYLTQFRSGDLIFVRVKATGPIFEAGTPGQAYAFTYDTALGIKSLKSLGKDVDGVTGVEIDTEFVTDGTSGKAVAASVTNAIATL